MTIKQKIDYRIRRILYDGTVFDYQYKVKGETYNGKSQWFWFNPYIPKGTPIKILVDPKNPTRSTVLNPENQGCEKTLKEKNYE